MGSTAHRTSLPPIASLAVALLVLLGVRFFASVALVALAPPAGALAIAGSLSEGLEVALALAVLPIVFALAWAWARTRVRKVAWVAALGVHLVALIVWAGGVFGSASAETSSATPYLIVIATTVGAALCLLPADRLGRWPGDPRGQAHLTLLVLVPLVMALRVGAGLGLGTWEQGGVLHGNWYVVNVPTLLFGFFAIGVWAAVILGTTSAEVRRRWYALLPLAAVVALPVAFAARPLAGYVFSALVTWGSNLELFVPTWVSLTIAVAAVACYLSTFLILPRSKDRRSWNFLLLGTMTILFAGFFASMASVEGLTLGLALVTVAVRGAAPARG